MPLIDCPECGERISDSASSCPHCGYPLSPSSSPPEITSNVRSTPLSPVQKNKTAGIIALILGIIAIPTAIFGFIMGIIPGILLAFGAMSAFAISSNYLNGIRNGICPYCGGKVVVTNQETSATKCPSCKKRIAIKGDHLETID